MMDAQKVSAIVRLIVLLYAVLNSVLLMFGINPLPFTEEEVSAGITAVLAVVASILVWWKNNNVTKEAQEAQRILDNLKNKK